MTRSSVSIALSTVLALGLTAGAQQASTPQEPRQQPPLTFRSMTNVVEVDAIVTDRDGAFVRDLQREDFEVFEDGKPVPLSVFSLIDIPIERPDPLLFRAHVIEPDVVSNERPIEGRIFVIVLDSYHVSSALTAPTRQQARTFVERFFGENDLGAVVHVGNAAAGQEFTSNRRLLIEAIDRFSGQKLRSATENLVRDALAVQNLPAEIAAQPFDNEMLERAYMARESIATMGRTAESLLGLRGRRKALLLFSEGIDYNILDAPRLAPGAAGFAPPASAGDSSNVRLAQTDMIAAASRANVSVYAIDPRGLASTLPDITIGALPGASDGARAEVLDVASSVQSSARNEVLRAQESMRTFADETGGLAFVSSNDIDDAFRRVIADNSSYYLLGYVSPDRRRDGRYHRMSVRVKRPGLRVRTRNSYRAPDDDGRPPAPADPIGDLLASPAPIAGLGMRAHAGVVRRPDGKGRVRLTVEFKGEDVGFETRAGRAANDIEIGLQAIDMKGVARAWSRHEMHLKLMPAAHRAFPQTGVRYVTEFDLLPGRYQVRVAAREQVGGHTGSLFYDLVVPDFAKVPLTMSDLLITSSAASRTLTAEGAPTIGSRLPSQTTTARTFDRSEMLSVYAGVYDTESRPHTIDLKVTVTADDGAQVFSQEDSRPGEVAEGQTKELPYTLGIPLQTLRPGRYVLTVEARSRLGPTVKKEVEFRVR